jgi:CRISPR-associated exonuclease Cas4
MKKTDPDSVQLCAQALCLEEMLETTITTGAVFYGKARRRKEVAFDKAIRDRTGRIADAVRAMLLKGETPLAEYGRKCADCSLMEVCCPEQAEGGLERVREYIRMEIEEALKETEGTQDEAPR